MLDLSWFGEIEELWLRNETFVGGYLEGVVLALVAGDEALEALSSLA